MAPCLVTVSSAGRTGGGWHLRLDQQRKPRAEVVARVERQKAAAEVAIVVIEMHPTPLLDATPWQCRWLLDGYSEPTVCGGHGRPWCPGHRAKVYQPESKRKDAA